MRFRSLKRQQVGAVLLAMLIFRASIAGVLWSPFGPHVVSCLQVGSLNRGG